MTRRLSVPTWVDDTPHLVWLTTYLPLRIPLLRDLDCSTLCRCPPVNYASQICVFLSHSSDPGVGNVDVLSVSCLGGMFDWETPDVARFKSFRIKRKQRVQLEDSTMVQQYSSSTLVLCSWYLLAMFRTCVSQLNILLQCPVYIITYIAMQFTFQLVMMKVSRSRIFLSY